MYGHDMLSEPDMLIEGLVPDCVVEPIAVPTVQLLMDLADLQCVINLVIDHLLSGSNAPATQRLEQSLKEFLQRAVRAGNSEPGYVY